MVAAWATTAEVSVAPGDLSVVVFGQAEDSVELNSLMSLRPALGRTP